MNENNVEAPLTPEAEEILLIAIQRARANLLCFPRFCFKGLCRRAGTCSADPDICMRRLGPLVPGDVRNGVNALLCGKFDGLSYEQVRAKAPFDIGAYEEWIAMIPERTALLTGRNGKKVPLTPITS